MTGRRRRPYLSSAQRWKTDAWAKSPTCVRRWRGTTSWLLLAERRCCLCPTMIRCAAHGLKERRHRVTSRLHTCRYARRWTGSSAELSSSDTIFSELDELATLAEWYNQTGSIRLLQWASYYSRYRTSSRRMRRSHWFDVPVSMTNVPFSVDIARTEDDVITFLNLWNATWQSSVHLKTTYFRVQGRNNFREILNKSRRLLGSDKSTTAEMFSGSVIIASLETRCPKKGTFVWSRKHLLGCSFNPAAAIFPIPGECVWDADLG